MTPNIDIIKDFSKLQADVNSLSKSNVLFVNQILELQDILKKVQFIAYQPKEVRDAIEILTK